MDVRVRIALALLVLLAACGEPDPAGGTEPLDGAWQLRSARVDGEAIALLDDHRVTATITGDEIGGRAACNSYGAAMREAEGAVTFGIVFQTDMGCEAPVMEIEAAYMSALARVTSAERSGPVLLLAGPGVELEFELLGPAPTADLVGVTWMLSGIVQGDTVTSPAEGADGPGEPAMLLLRADGTLTGHTGCRELSGEYIVSGDEILFTSFSAEGDCIPELQRQDDQIVTVLGDGFTAEIAGDRLTVTSTGGEGLVFRAGP
jgi:heat shock protein HslJ